MADRLRIVIDDISATIKQTFDDKEITQAQIAYWTILSANQLLAQHVSKRDSGAFMSTFVGVPVKKSITSSGNNIVKGRKYIELPSLIFDYDKDGGVEYIAYYVDNKINCPGLYAKKTIQRTSPGEVQWLNLHKSTSPSPSNPYWYRTGNIIYLLGIEGVPVDEVEVGLYTTIDPLEKIDIDKPFNFPQELMQTLKRYVLDLARYSFFFPSERSNDGADQAGENSTQNIPKVISVNDQQQQ